jgi:hypothetical protein
MWFHGINGTALPWQVFRNPINAPKRLMRHGTRFVLQFFYRNPDTITGFDAVTLRDIDVEPERV